MKKPYLFVIGVSAAFVILSGMLVALWLRQDGSLRNVHWRQPQAITMDVAALVPNMPQSQARDDGRLLLQLQERPLFILSRRPLPSAKKAEEKAPEPDIWDQARLLGIFEGHKSGAILMVQGKEQRLLLRQNLGGWTLAQVLPRQIELEKGGAKRRLNLQRAVDDKGATPVSPSSLAGEVNTATAAGSSTPATRNAYTSMVRKAGRRAGK